jgi:hypothetical protein
MTASGAVVHGIMVFACMLCCPSTFYRRLPSCCSPKHNLISDMLLQTQLDKTAACPRLVPSQALQPLAATQVLLTPTAPTRLQQLPPVTSSAALCLAVC